MTESFDELVGSELTEEERERLQRVHELLVLAGPPPELSPELERTPIPDVAPNVHVLGRKRRGRRAVVLLAAALVILLVFIGGFSRGHRGSALSLKLHGTAVAQHAQGQLVVFHPTERNSPMELTVSGLPKLPQHAYYEVYLVRNGKPWGSCGTFVVRTTAHPVTFRLRAPYALHDGDTWVVTRERRGQKGIGRPVLRPVRA